MQGQAIIVCLYDCISFYMKYIKIEEKKSSENRNSSLQTLFLFRARLVIYQPFTFRLFGFFFFSLIITKKALSIDIDDDDDDDEEEEENVAMVE